jgi:hypothetical protein
LLPDILAVLRSGTDDEDLSPRIINQSIRKVVYSIEPLEVIYSGCIPDELRARGTLTGSSAESFIEYAESHLSGLKRRVNGDIHNHVTNLIDRLRKVNLSSEIFRKYEGQIIELERQVENKEVELDAFVRVIKELKGVC